MRTPQAEARTGLSLTITAGGTLLALFVFTAPLSIVPSVAEGLHAGTSTERTRVGRLRYRRKRPLGKKG